MILAFKPQFVLPILDGTKIHSIRADVHHRWHAGNTIQCATGVRTKQYNHFAEHLCKSVQNIHIAYKPFNGIVLQSVTINGNILSGEQIHQLAINDGFANVTQFFDWFTTDFVGKIIHWTNFTY